MARLTASAQRARHRRTRRQPVRPGRGRDIRPDRDQPAVRHLAARREVLVYRDSGMPGDSVVRHLVENAAAHLNDGGWCQILANWAHHDGRDWQDELEEWFAGQPLDAWVVQRELVDPSEYVEMWLADAGLASAPDYVQRYDAWLDWFAEVGIEAVGFGWLSMRRRLALRFVDSRSGPARSRRRSGRRLPAWGHAIGPAARPRRRRLCSIRACGMPPTSSRRPVVRSAPSTRSRSCCACSRAYAAPARSTRSRRDSSAPARAT